jgi:hypothetical protein
MTYREMCEARKEKMQQRQNSDLISVRFPGVSSIIVAMEHHKKGMDGILLSRTLNFSPETHAYFRAECLNRECRDCTDGFDLEQVIVSMIGGHASSRKGELYCEGNSLTSGSVNITYNVTIRYNAG